MKTKPPLAFPEKPAALAASSPSSERFPPPVASFRQQLSHWLRLQEKNRKLFLKSSLRHGHP